MYKSRKAQFRVSIYLATVSADGYGGNLTAVSTLVGTRWCAIEDQNANQLQTEAGLKEFNDTYRFTFRYDSQLIIDAKKHVLKYGSDYYSILSVKTEGFKRVSQIVTAKKTIDD
jgi:hypothetical protein